MNGTRLHRLRHVAVGVLLALFICAPAAYAYSGSSEYYVNHDGKLVHRPERVQGACPSNASARCGDGECSFSLHHRGTCSGHGGVAQWYR